MDRAALQSSGKISSPEASYTPPETPVEIQLADIWKNILNTDIVGIHDNFLDLGGNSILAMKLLQQIKKEFDIQLTIQGLFENLTISALARKIVAISDGAAVYELDNRLDLYAETTSDMVNDTDGLETASPVATDLKNVFITGATGFLGVYILQRLLERTGADLYCLVRAKDGVDGARRIQNNMEKHQLWQECYAERIKPVTGDLSLPKLGIVQKTYDFLLDAIDVIHHCGSIVNFAYPYSFLKKSNVEGTKEIIKMACQKRVKPLFYVSTIGVFEQPHFTPGQRIHEDDELPSPEGLFFGYSQSKWVAEKIIAAARDNGLPVSILRPGLVLGDSKTGIANLEDLFNIIIRACIINEAYPLMDFKENGLPVDNIAETIVDISFKPEAAGKSFHIVNAGAVPVSQLVSYAISYGYDFPILPYEKWFEKFMNMAETNEELGPFLSVIEKELTTMIGNELPTFLFENTSKLIEGYEESTPVIDEKLFHTYLKQLEEIGYIKKSQADTADSFRDLEN